VLPDEEQIRQRIADLDALPEVAVARLRETAARSRAVEASANYAPVLTTGAQLERTAGDFGAWVVYGIAGVTFRGPGQQRRLTSIAHAEAAGAAVETDAAMLQARAELEEGLHDLKHTGAVIALLEEDTLPALHDLVESRTRAVAFGEDSYFALFEARDREHAAVEAAHRARGAHTWARVHMWLLLAELEGEGADR
jgi:outer membrane protein TolC